MGVDNDTPDWRDVATALVLARPGLEREQAITLYRQRLRQAGAVPQPPAHDSEDGNLRRLLADALGVAPLPATDGDVQQLAIACASLVRAYRAANDTLAGVHDTLAHMLKGALEQLPPESPIHARDQIEAVWTRLDQLAHHNPVGAAVPEGKDGRQAYRDHLAAVRERLDAAIAESVPVAGSKIAHHLERVRDLLADGDRKRAERKETPA